MQRLSRVLPHLATAVLLAALAAPSARATTFVMMSDADLAHHAELIAEVVIDRSAPSEIAGSPATAYEARVESVLKGALAEDRLTFKVPGGQGPSGVSLKLWGMPVFLPEGRALVFLSRNGDGSWGILQFLLGAFHEIGVGSRRVALRDLTDAVEVQLEDRGELKTVEEPLDVPRDWTAFKTWLADFGRGQVRQPDYLLSERDPIALSSKYTFLLPEDGIPIRWFDFDSNLDITWRADSTGQIGVPGGGFAEIQQAINVWNNDPNSNIRYRYNGTRALRQPACTSPSRDGLITFDDTTGYIAGNYECDTGGILAVGGPCYDPSQLLAANGRNWRPASDAFVVTNNNLECFFSGRGNAGCNMAELMTHELGHTLGLGHSATFAATMFATFHGDNRCAALRDDDRAGIAFMYGNGGGGGGGGTTVTAPTNLTATVLSNTQVALAWQDKSNNETSFRIEAKTTGSFSEIANVGAGVTTYTAVGLMPNTAYSFRVRARANSANSGYSNTATVTTPGTPTPPSELRTTSSTPNSLTLAWNDNSTNETGFRLERRSLASSTFQVLATLPAGTTSYTNISLSAATRYEYRVRAESSAGASAFSNVLSTNTKGLAAPCVAGARTLCLEGGRVKVEVFFRDQASLVDRANAIPLTNQSGTFWFFNADNVELIVKAIDANGVNGNFWIFYGALSDREYEIAATNTQTGEAAVYYNPQGEICGGADTSAFPVASTAAAGFTFERLGTLAAPVELASPIQSIEQGLCAPGAGKLCLFGNRFEVEVDWSANNQTGDGVAVPSTDLSGFFWFFSAQNLELVVKVIDGRTVNGKFWFFYGALTNVQYDLRVRDTVSGASKTYSNAQGNICGQADTSAF